MAATSHAQRLAVKTNAVGWAFYGTLNLGAEVALAPRWTLDVQGFYNPWEFSDHKQSKFRAVQPELRHWFCRKFAGHFVGLHGGYADYDFGMNKYRYDGWTTSLGASYGYSLPVAAHWRVEANLGLGWLHKEYDRSDRVQYPGDVVMYDPQTKNCFGITRAGLSIVFLIH